MYDSIKNRFTEISHKIQAASIQAKRSKDDIKLIDDKAKKIIHTFSAQSVSYTHLTLPTILLV